LPSRRREFQFFPERQEEPPWEEQKPELPAFPKDENLVKIQVDGG